MHASPRLASPRRHQLIWLGVTLENMSAAIADRHSSKFDVDALHDGSGLVHHFSSDHGHEWRRWR
jgi:hypothetical protein